MKPADMIGWVGKILGIPKALISARRDTQSWKSMKPIRRFVELFEGHGVERTQIPRFLKSFDISLSLADVATDDALLHKLDEVLLDKVCNIFGVRREWLDGASEQIYPNVWFYKNLPEFSDLMDQLYDKYEEIELIAIKSPENKLDKDLFDHNLAIAIVIKARLGYLGDTPIYRYISCGDDWCWGYWKSRYELKGLALFAWQYGNVVFGCHQPQKVINGIIQGDIFPGPKIEHAGYMCHFRLDYMIFTEDESMAADDPEEALKVREYLRGESKYSGSNDLEYIENKRGLISEYLPSSQRKRRRLNGL